MNAESPSSPRQPIELPLIVPGSTSPPAARDNQGGELQTGIVSRIFGGQKVTKTVADLPAQLEKLSSSVSQVMEHLGTSIGDAVQFKEVEVALAISAEGSIGFATTGIEATFTVTFERRRQPGSGAPEIVKKSG